MTKNLLKLAVLPCIAWLCISASAQSDTGAVAAVPASAPTNQAPALRDMLAGIAVSAADSVTNGAVLASTNSPANTMTISVIAGNDADEPVATNDIWRVRLPAAVETAKDTNIALWFPVGESLAYNLYWGVIPVGRATMETSWTNFEGRTVLSLLFKAKTSTVVSKMFNVDDTIESVVDPVAFLPVRYTERIAEGRYRAHHIIHFDHAAGLAHWRSVLKSTSKDLKIDSDTRDVLCLMYCLRAGGMKVGDHARFRVLVSEKLYDLTVTARKESKVFVTAFGDVECLEVKPVARFGEIFVRKGEVTMWFSKDDRHILTKTHAEVKLATFQAILSEVKGDESSPWIGGSKTKRKARKLAGSLGIDRPPALVKPGREEDQAVSPVPAP